MAATHREQRVRSPIAYVATLATRYLSGSFVAAKAHREQERRQREAMMEASMRAHEARFADELAGKFAATTGARGDVVSASPAAPDDYFASPENR
jgi:hypothetical protein